MVKYLTISSAGHPQIKMISFIIIFVIAYIVFPELLVKIKSSLA